MLFRKQWQKHICACSGKMASPPSNIDPHLVEHMDTKPTSTEGRKILIFDSFVSSTIQKDNPSTCFHLMDHLHPSDQNPSQHEEEEKVSSRQSNIIFVFLFNRSLAKESKAKHGRIYPQNRPLSVVLILVVTSPDNQERKTGVMREKP